MSFITEEMWRSNRQLKEFKEVSKPLTLSDVATLVEVFEIALTEVKSSSIAKILSNDEGYFLFLVKQNEETDFDFYGYLNKYYTGSVEINCINAKRVFSKALSKGIYPGFKEVSVTVNDYDDDEESSTGFMDEEDILQITKGMSFSLQHSKTGNKSVISSTGIIVGRSNKTADFVLHGNTNVSRNHCKVYRTPQGIYVKDLGSVNGTYVNGVKVVGEVKLDIGDSILVADEEFIIV